MRAALGDGGRMDIDIRALELLASKLCHDLISPVSAINNGVELIEDIGGSVVDEAMKLIGDSAGQASRRLKLYRLSYGRAGGEESIGVRDVRQVAVQVFSGGKTTLNWPESVTIDGYTATRGALKVLLNVLIMAEEILAYGGVIAVKASEVAEAACTVEVMGRGAGLNEAMRSALEGKTLVEDLTPRTIQAYMTRAFMQQFMFDIRTEQKDDERMCFTIRPCAIEHAGNQLVANY